jgi:hypothetical protein
MRRSRVSWRPARLPTQLCARRERYLPSRERRARLGRGREWSRRGDAWVTAVGSPPERSQPRGGRSRNTRSRVALSVHL